jgi:hypothetical protein
VPKHLAYQQSAQLDSASNMLNILTLIIKGLKETFKINDTQNNVTLLIIIMLSAEVPSTLLSHHTKHRHRKSIHRTQELLITAFITSTQYMNDTQTSVIMLNITMTDCCYAEHHYSEFQGTLYTPQPPINAQTYRKQI